MRNSNVLETNILDQLGCGHDFPDILYILKHPPSGKYGCYCHQGVHGLAVFSSETAALRFAEWIDLDDMICPEVTFNQAIDVAKARPHPIVCIILLDSMNDPKIFYVC